MFLRMLTFCIRTKTFTGFGKLVGERDEIMAVDGKGMTQISLVVPVYNEADCVEHFVARVRDVFSADVELEVEVVFVNDGSSDNTLDRLLGLQKSYPSICVVDLSRNFGKEAALTAGLKMAKGHAIIPIDVDLQDPIELIPQMILKWREGYEVVVAKRTNRASDTWLKRGSANLFYKLHNTMSDTQIPENAGDFRLMDRVVVDALNDLNESRRFMKGLFAWVGFRTSIVEYERPERIAGSSKFSGWRLWNFAIEGITSFSTVPLRVWTYIGLTVSSISILFALFLIARVFWLDRDVPGYASIMVAITLLGGLQLMGIGVIGEYLGRTYIEAKSRPAFVIRKIYTGKV